MNSNFKGAAKRLDDIDLPKIGATIGVGEDEIHAVMDGETAGSGFDSQGRPRMLFEPHIFYRNLSGSQRDRAVNAGLAYPKWRRNYPKDSYPRLQKAIVINATAALKSASWGLGQVMGFNHKVAGYETVQQMVKSFMADEEHQLAGMIAFIKNNHLDDELREHNWAGFARGYNGSGYRKNNYHTKLANAYAKWRRIRDTEWDENMVVDPTPPKDPVIRPVSPPITLEVDKKPPTKPIEKPAEKPSPPKGIIAMLLAMLRIFRK